MRLSHQLAPLRVVRNKIVNARTGVEVILRGVNRSGLEYSSLADPLISAGISQGGITEIVEHWGATIIRLPFNQEWALETPRYDPQPYRTAIEAGWRWPPAVERTRYSSCNGSTLALCAGRWTGIPTTSRHCPILISSCFGSSSVHYGVMSQQSFLTSSTGPMTCFRMTMNQCWV